jgi:hypothetical protein
MTKYPELMEKVAAFTRRSITQVVASRIQQKHKQLLERALGDLERARADVDLNAPYTHPAVRAQRKLEWALADAERSTHSPELAAQARSNLARARADVERSGPLPPLPPHRELMSQSVRERLEEAERLVQDAAAKVQRGKAGKRRGLGRSWLR